MKYGLLGENIGYSYSPMIHRMLGNDNYELFDVPKLEFDNFMKIADFDGINVTIPYKEKALKYCKTLSEDAKKIGCVNVVTKDLNGYLHGFNTDYAGFEYMSSKAGISFNKKKVLILGSGATSRTIKAFAENVESKEIVRLSRSGEDSYSNIQKFRDFDLIVNATPVGACPNANRILVDLRNFFQRSGVLDVVYNPFYTRLIQQARQLRVPNSGGIWMLAAQAKYACEIFHNTKIDDSAIENTVCSLERKLSNIIIIGMPGCGKSSAGKIVAEKMNRDFIDIDDEISKDENMSIDEIFKKFGEARFRKLEAAKLLEYGQKNSLVIAAGGGAALTEDNRVSMRYNGFIIWLTRKLEKLDTAGRPLSNKSGGVKRLFEERAHIYEEASMAKVENREGDIDKAARQIVDIFNNAGK